MSLEKIQFEAGRIASGTTKLVGNDKLCAELGWLKLSERRNLHKFFLFFKMGNGQAPLYLTDLIPPRVGDISNYPLRNSYNYVSINTNEPGHEKTCLMSFANDKGADQPAHPRSLISAFVVRCPDSVMSLVAVTKISSFLLASVAQQASLSLTWSETPVFSWRGSLILVPTPTHFFHYKCME